MLRNCRAPSTAVSEANSPTYAVGLLDGLDDEARIKSCPSVPALGECPPFPDYPVMYLRGYWSVYTGVAHRCSRECRRRTEAETQNHNQG